MRYLKVAVLSLLLALLISSALSNNIVPVEAPTEVVTVEVQDKVQERAQVEAQDKTIVSDQANTHVETTQSKVTVSRGGQVFDYDRELYWLSRVVSAEAKGEPVEGQIAVANVVLNRAREQGSTVKEVIFAKNQFSSVTNKSIYDEPTEQAVKSAREALNGKKVIPNEVMYFYNPKLTSKKSWIRTRRIFKDIGQHRFCY